MPDQPATSKSAKAAPAPPPSGVVSTAAMDRVTADLDFVSDRLSSQARSVSIGVIAIVWAVSVGDLKQGVSPPRAELLVIAAAAVLTMSLDFLQYVAAFWTGRRALISVLGGGDGLYDATWWSYRLRSALFWAKLVCAALTGLATVGVLGHAILATLDKAERPAVVCTPERVGRVLLDGVSQVNCTIDADGTDDMVARRGVV